VTCIATKSQPHGPHDRDHRALHAVGLGGRRKLSMIGERVRTSP
jgi:hypothetical protein